MPTTCCLAFLNLYQRHNNLIKKEKTKYNIKSTMYSNASYHVKLKRKRQNLKLYQRHINKNSTFKDRKNEEKITVGVLWVISFLLKNVPFCSDNKHYLCNKYESEITQTGSPGRTLCLPVTHPPVTICVDSPHFLLLTDLKAHGIWQYPARYLKLFHQRFSHAAEDSHSFQSCPLSICICKWK